uniref:RING-type domain-containing protein n=1 Tax=Chromera velia CCMP2878 TaxID=1169474 RepID=A0A0G4I5W9_9ALVE|eukprot:Cvel_11245.t1-p1 / transcript=Cvel_11245.t1 / gene=Cvel_11245 / organism=Chromera_velia_CCMP2878 / gene_product=hypothetical protein / transcript_product=hypothetical protein / location=Cvel_scaffold700:62019-64461(-) / protein_length=328 / sequence_SO=supercontig / SO=protein_coding / is_pseudo=false
MKGTYFRAQCVDGKKMPFVIGYAVVEEVLGGWSNAKVERFAARVSDHWGLGHAGCGNPVLVFMSKDDRVLTIRTGAQAKRFVTDAVSKEIVREAIEHLKGGNLNYALELVALRLREQLNGQAPYRWIFLWEKLWPWLLGFGIVLFFGFCICAEYCFQCFVCCGAGCCYGLLFLLTLPGWLFAFCIDGCCSCCCCSKRSTTAASDGGTLRDNQADSIAASTASPPGDPQETEAMARVYAALQRQAAADLRVEFTPSAPPLSNTTAAAGTDPEKGEAMSPIPLAPPLPDDLCSICLDPLHSDSSSEEALPVATLTCSHAFHQVCISEWGD